VRVAQKANASFAVRGGGHSPFPGFANINNGFLLSMKDLNDLTYDATTQTLLSGYGNRWGDLYRYLAPLGRVVVGGRVGDVGMGLLLGGRSHLVFTLD